MSLLKKELIKKIISNISKILYKGGEFDKIKFDDNSSAQVLCGTVLQNKTKVLYSIIDTRYVINIQIDDKNHFIFIDHDDYDLFIKNENTFIKNSLFVLLNITALTELLLGQSLPTSPDPAMIPESMMSDLLDFITYLDENY